MAVEVRWLEAAEQDLLDTYEYLSAVSPNAAVAYVEDIVAATRRLSDFPQSARRYDARYRVLTIRNHLVFYSFNDVTGLVSIVAIVDGRRDIDALLGEQE